MSVRTRFRVWAGVVAACFVGMLLVAVGVRAGWAALAACGALTQGLGVAAIAWLVATTPADAIKLKAKTSWVLILLGLAANFAAGGVRAETAIVIGVLLTLGAAGWLVLIRNRLRSPWWIALLWWAPVFVWV